MSALVRFVLVLSVLLPTLSVAHSGSASFVRVAEAGGRLSIAVSLDLRDAQYAFGVDNDRNGEITWGELIARRDAFESYVRERVRLRRGTSNCDLALDDLKVDEISGSIYAVAQGTSVCAGSAAIEVRSDLMFDLDTGHRTLIEWSHRDQTALAVLTSTHRDWRGTQESGVLAQLSAFALEGMLHIWSGFDHLAFLLILLLPVFMKNAGAARGMAPGKLAWRKLFAIISAFTLAHSITLALAISGVVNAPPGPIEVAIAVSVIVAALTNVVPSAHAIGVPTAFAFGLLHGFGFAWALEGLGATTASFATALAGFNLGVEAGQLAVVAAVFPFMLWLRMRPIYATRAVPAVSLLVAVIGAVWVWERVTL